MKTAVAIVACAAGVCLSSLCAAAFTTAQATRGLLAYEQSCTKCHQSDLQGNQETEAPGLAGDMFRSRWARQPIKDLFDKVSTKMPADEPASLTTSAYLDIVAYLLQANRIPADSSELDLKPESLARMIF